MAAGLDWRGVWRGANTLSTDQLTGIVGKQLPSSERRPPSPLPEGEGADGAAYARYADLNVQCDLRLGQTKVTAQSQVDVISQYHSVGPLSLRERARVRGLFSEQHPLQSAT